MRILATADLHGNLPEIPECDLLLIGGDVCPMYDHHVDVQLQWLDSYFRLWLKNVPARHIIGIAGNHDFVFEQRSASVDALRLPWEYLEGDETSFEDLWIWGLPWVPNLPSWAFYASAMALGEAYDKVPKGVDIVLSHGPPRGYGDFTSPMYGSAHVGSRAAKNMLERVKPQAFVCGHIHEGYGHYRHTCQHGHEVDIYNVSFVDEHYTPRYSVPADWTGQPVPPHLKPDIVEIMIDAQQESPNPVSELRDQDPDARLTQEPDQGRESSGDVLAAVADR